MYMNKKEGRDRGRKREREGEGERERQSIGKEERGNLDKVYSNPQ